MTDQNLLFTEEECDQLQEILRNNYREEFQKHRFTFSEDSEKLEISSENKIKGCLQDDLFNIEQIQEKNNLIVLKKLEAEVKAAQQLMQLPYFDNPKNDNEKMLNYQHDFIKKGDKEAWGKLLELAYVVTKRLIWRWLKSHQDIYLDEISQDEKASITVEYVLRRYKTRAGWYADNFIVVLQEGLKHAMLYHTKIDDMTCSLDEINESVGKKKKKS